jgi:L,D-transpeptidase YcbB
VRTFVVSLLLTSTAVVSACRSQPAPDEVTPVLEVRVAGEPLPNIEPEIWTDLRAFYTRRAHAPAWADHRRPTKRGFEALALLGTAPQHGFDPEDYGTAALLDAATAIETLERDSPARLGKIAEFDAALTAALLAFGRDVAVGRGTVAYWRSQRTAPDYVTALAAAASEGDLDEWLAAMRPPHPEYAALQQALHDLSGQQDKGGWARVPAMVKPGASGPDVAALRRRLAASGQLRDADGDTYDADVEAAVKAFQSLHALPATGVVDKLTLAALNVPLDERMRQVAINLQRWRWMPNDLGARHFIVNVPYFHVIAREQGRAVLDSRVIVGAVGNKTPIFSEEMETVVFSPYWNIPDSIAQGETVPALARDPAYLQKQNIEILRQAGGRAEPVNPADVAWDDPRVLDTIRFRQRPGPGNALGHVKFLFPNPHNVYLHDTPAHNLFERPRRALSHGCVRVEEPLALAKYVLRDQPEWDETAIRKAMQSGVEKHVRLKEKIPVHLVYFTAWVDAEGGLHFQPDIYGYDRPGEN